jgi:activator of 2-hydroxyglutaryl-CoA dehydratase
MSKENFEYEEYLKTIQEHKNKTNFKNYYLGVDVGGTNTRVVLLLSKEFHTYETAPFFKFNCQSIDVLLEKFNLLAEDLYKIFSQDCSGSVFAVAGPISEEGDNVFNFI